MALTKEHSSSTRDIRCPRENTDPEEQSVDGVPKSDAHSSTDGSSPGFFDRAANWADHVLGKEIAEPLRFYEVPKMVKIRAAPLQIPKLTFQAIGIVYACVWLIWNLHFLQRNNITSRNAVIDVSFPQKNFNVCHDPDIDCDDLGAANESATAASYCSDLMLANFRNDATQYFFTDSSGKHEYSKARWTKKPDVEIDCKQLDAHDVLRSSARGPLIATAITTVAQDRCEAGDCIWENRGFKVDVADDSERFLIKLRHQVQTDDGLLFTNSEATGFLDIDGKRHVLRCTDAKEKSGDCHYDLEAWKYDFESCDIAGEGNCFSTGFADFISLRTLLLAANISMDDGISGGLPRRWWGTALAIDVEYSNNRPQDFWLHWPPQTHATYTYAVRKLDDYVWESEVHYDGGRKRHLVRHSGINLVVSVQGSLHSFHAWHFIKVFAVFSIAFSLSVAFVDTAVLFLYKRSPLHRHIPIIHEYYSYEETPDHSVIKGVGYQNLEAVEHEVRMNYHKRLSASSECDE
eukprot:TRINITY_DN90231_c0_g1_i1.p1 TRINITY_DN90231_c0_g1~~TRINITY_DN90231_c0_g1_i1.p1  ORF type:complete len:518 (+),score=68.80 TRINITY_DN90231_c0_g1_i1:39-1592(+)